MEKSLDQLIEHLLGEIALCGPAGATVADLTTFVDDFYYGTRNNHNVARSVTQVVDDAFIASAWRWLGQHPDVSIGADKIHNTTPIQSLVRSGASFAEQSSTLPRISVIDSRIYQAICGHAPDSRRVFKSEYGLLLVIAAARSDGILQGELGRTAGQDKRSVPKRTDSLHAKGYIIKETVILRGFKSSRLTLRRFATQAQITQAEGALTNHASRVRQQRIIHDVVNDIVSTLGTVDLIETEDLAKRVKMSTQLAQKTLLKILRVLSKAGYLKKVKAAVGASAHTGEPKICFRRMRDFTDTDLTGFADTPFDLSRAISEVLEETDANSPTADLNATEEDEVAVQWNPDRNIVNALQHAAVLAGARGISNISARKLVTGMTIKRPVESQLNRISFASLVAQPDHLRHLAVVRSNRGAVGGPQYVHHSFSDFLQGVESGKIDTAGVPGAVSLLRERRPAAHKSMEVDHSGFPVVRSSSLVNDGTATLTDCVRSAFVEDVGDDVDDMSDADHRSPKRVKTAAVSTPPASRSATSIVNSSAQKSGGSHRLGRNKRGYTQRKPLKREAGVVKGRPRKFLAGTEKFWQHHFLKAKIEVDGPDAARAGTMNHPAGKALFQGRPEIFDETLVQARAAELPLPKTGEDISTAWVQRTQEVLRRNGPGAYVSPAGMFMSRVLHTSQKLIVRSDKLHTVDFRERPKVYAYRFLASMVAHSFQNWRWYPTKPPQSKRARPLPLRKLDVEYPEELLDAFGKLPRMGIFYETSATSQAQPLPSLPTNVPRVTAEEYRELTAETDVDSEVERQEEQERSKPPPATPRTGLAGVPSSTRRTPTRSNSDQVDGIEDTSPATITVRRRRSMQTTTEWNDSGLVGPSVGSLSAFGDSTLELGDNDDRDDERDDDDAAGEADEAIPPHLSPSELSANPINQTLGSVKSYFSARSELPAQADGMSLLSNPVNGASILADPPQVRTGVPFEINALVTGPDATSNAGLEGLPNGPENGHRQEERAKILYSRGIRGGGAHCRKALLSLLMNSGGLAPQNLDLLRRYCGDHWRLQGQPGLPSASVVKSSLQGLVDSGLLKRHTFSFRSTGGVMLSRSILFFPEMHVTDAEVQQLKQEIIKADIAEYVPPQWKNQTESTEQSAVPTPETVEDEPQTIEDEETPSRPLRKRRSRAAPTRRTSSISRGSRPVSLSPSPATGFLSLRTSRSPSVRSRSSTVSSGQSDINIGFLTLKVPRLGTLPQVQQFNAKFETPEYLKTAPLIAPVAGPPVPKKPRRPRAVKPKKDTSLQKVIWKTPRLPESLEDLLNEQYEHDPSARSRVAQHDTQTITSQLQTVLEWEERLADKLVETKTPWTFINFIATPPTIALDELGTWYRVKYLGDGSSSEIEIDNVESWLPFKQALEKSRLEPGLGSSTPSTSTGRRVTRLDTGSIRKKRRFNFDDVEIEEGGRRKRPRKQVDTDFEDEEPLTEPRREKRPYNRKKGNPVESQHASILSKTSNEDIFRVTVSVVLVRTLVGGPEKTINWNIVNKLHPTLLRSTITSRWKAVEFTYPDEVGSMTSSLRSLYLDAVQASEVPMVNFSSHGDSAWEHIFSWALVTLNDFLKENILPASRTALLNYFSLDYTIQQNIRPLLAPGANLRAYEREEHVVSVPFSASIPQPASLKGLVEYARSLVLSTLLTTSYPSRIANLASQQLLSMSSDRNTAEQATATALRELMSDKVIIKSNTSLKRMPPLIENGKRAYGLAEKMSEMLEFKRTVNRGLLAEAVDYKLDVLDAAFEVGEAVEIPNQGQITNGRMIAVLNLLGSGMIKVRPGHGSKKSRYGVAWERVGYQSKQVDAKDIGFDVVIERNDSYIFGDVGDTARGDAPTQGGNGQHPMWIDLHGDVLTRIWEKVLAAVVGIASARPGVQVTEVKEMLGGVLTQWEVETVLQWAESRRFARRTVGAGGWETEEWWWMCLGKDADWGSWGGDE